MNLEFRPAMHDVSMSGGGEKPVSRASENRRATKPIMEKRRRARINQCLSELKTLILDALNKDPSRHSKLEKADILEMTVRHLQNIQRQQMAAAISSDSSVLNKFKAGFNECASEVTRYVSRAEGVEPALRQRLLAHLSNCLTAMSAPAASSFPGLLQSLSVQIPALRPGGDLNNNGGGGASGGKLFAGLSVIPSRLPNGDLAFLLPSQALAASGGAQMFHLPTVSLPSSSSSSTGGQEPRTASQSSWPGRGSPSPGRSVSPDPLSDDNAVLSPACSDAGSDVFIEPYQHHQRHHRHHQRLPSPYPAHPCKEGSHHPAPPSHLLHETENVWRPW